MFSSINIWVLVGALLTWIIFILGVAQLSRLYSRFVEASKSLDNNLNAVNAQLKKMQSLLAELIIEQRRQSRLQTEQLDLKRAEMTGDYEIVEEPIPEAVPPPNARNITLESNGK
jgi:biopolymer transport protein ExbB/TolQ